MNSAYKSKKEAFPPAHTTHTQLFLFRNAFAQLTKDLHPTA